MTAQQKPRVVDPGYRAAKFIELLRRYGMRSTYEAKVFPNLGARSLDRAPRGG